jgi:hypothetical protein
MVIVRARVFRREVLSGGLFVFVGYVSVFLFLLENDVEINYFGWVYIAILVVNASFISVG